MATPEMTTDAMEFDEAKAEAFSERFIAALNASSLMMMFSIGHRTGLFDTMDGMSWSTLPQIAKAAGLNDRYVREWLGAMVTGGVVEFQSADQTYRLPAEHARWLTRRATPENLSVTAQWISVLGCVETRIVDKFKTGGGLHYECFERFHETMAPPTIGRIGQSTSERDRGARRGLRLGSRGVFDGRGVSSQRVHWI
jgi:hypothetical protein